MKLLPETIVRHVAKEIPNSTIKKEGNDRVIKVGSEKLEIARIRMNKNVTRIISIAKRELPRKKAYVIGSKYPNDKMIDPSIWGKVIVAVATGK